MPLLIGTGGAELVHLGQIIILVLFAEIVVSDQLDFKLILIFVVCVLGGQVKQIKYNGTPVGCISRICAMLVVSTLEGRMVVMFLIFVLALVMLLEH